jgi:tRNA isopentenyl-2-thiomethyl-A-37 hydroxylase MiaE
VSLAAAVHGAGAVDARLAELAEHEAAVLAVAQPRPRLHST